MKLTQSELNKLKTFIKDLDYSNIKLNYGLIKNERIIDGILKDIKTINDKPKDIHDRIEINILNSQESYDFIPYVVNDVKLENLTFIEYFIKDLLSDSTSTKLDNKDTMFRGDILNIYNLIYAIKDLEFNDKVNSIITNTINSILEIKMDIINDKVYTDKIKFDVTYSNMEYDLYKKDDNDELILENKRPVFADKSKAEQKLQQLELDNKDVIKAYNDWINTEIEIPIAYCSIDDLPSDITKQQLTILMNFIN